MIQARRRRGFEQARELYADIWMGFSEVELGDLLLSAGFDGIEVSIVNRETEAPNLETVLATGTKGFLSPNRPAGI